MTGSTITGNTSKSIERHIGSSYKTIVYVSKYLNEVKIVSDNIESGVITDILDNLGTIALVYTNMDNVVTVASISEDVVAVANTSTEVIAVGTNIDDVVRVRQSIDEVIRVSQSSDNVDRIALSIDNLDRVFASIDNIDTVANHADAVDTVAANIAQVIATVDSIVNVNIVAANIAAVINASSIVDDIHASVDAAALSEANALSSEQASAANAASTSADKADVTTMRDEVETDRAEVELNTVQVSIDASQVTIDASQVTTDKGIVEGYKDESLAAKVVAQQWATGLSGSGVDVPSDTNNAYYFSEVARNNANQTFKSGGYFTPTVGQEYPDVTGVEVDTIWLIKFASASTSYTYTTGDLAGETLENGFMLVYDTPVDAFDFIPTTLSGVASVNGVTPNAVGNITIDAADVEARPDNWVPAWGDVTNKPVYATRWATWDEVTGKPDFDAMYAKLNEDSTFSEVRATGSIRADSFKDLGGARVIEPRATDDLMQFGVPFRKLRLRAKETPQFIDENNSITKLYHEGFKPTAADVGALPAGDKAVDSDKLGGYAPSINNLGTTIPVRNSSGYISATTYRASYNTQSEIGSDEAGIAFRNESGDGTADNYIRFINKTGLVSWLGRVNDSTRFLGKTLDQVKTETRAGLVPDTITVNGHRLNGDVSVTKGDVGLANVADYGYTNSYQGTSTALYVTQKAVNDAASAPLLDDNRKRVITSGTEAPTGGSDGDVYLQYS